MTGFLGAPVCLSIRFWSMLMRGHLGLPMPMCRAGQGSRMKPIYAQDRSAIYLEIPPLAGFCRVSAPVTSPKVPQP